MLTEADIVEGLKAGHIPTSVSLRDAIVGLFVTKALTALQSHVGYGISDKIRSIETTYLLFEQAFTDLMAALGDFDSFARTPDFHYRIGEARLHALETRVRKELYAFSSFAHSLQDHGRVLNKVWEPALLKEMRTKSFGTDGLHDFICKLRNSLHHQSMVEADWLIRGAGEDETTHFTLSKKELEPLSEDDWNVAAKAFLSKAKAEIDVGELTKEYMRRARLYYEWLRREFRDGPPDSVIDYRGLIRLQRARSERLTYNFVFTEFNKRGLDAFDYLDRYLTKEEREKIAQLPARSPEQVDAVIKILDDNGACDQELRDKIYRAFRVEQAAKAD